MSDSGFDYTNILGGKFKAVLDTLRRDGWENSFTGVGTITDKASQMRFRRNVVLTDPELRNLFHFHDLSKKIVSIRPREIFRRGFTVAVQEDKKLEKKINKWIKEGGLIQTLYEGKVWGRLFGGCLGIAGIDDGKDMSEPLEPDAEIKSVRYMLLLDKRYIWPAKFYEDPENSKYLKVEQYAISLPTGEVLTSRIHETRVIRFGGSLTDDSERLSMNGWDFSVLQHVIDVLKATENDFKSVNHLLADASQAVFKIKGLLASLVNPKGEETMRTRMSLVETCRSVARAVLLDADADESFERTTTSFAGVPDILDRSMMRTAAAAEYPVALLFGRSAAGMNATGDLDMRNFYDGIEAEQNTHTEPEIRRVLDWYLRAKDGPTQGVVPEDYTICFPSLWQPTPQEEALIAKTYAERDSIRILSDVWKPEEVAIARQDGEDNGPVIIDVDLRKLMAQNEKELASYGPNDPLTGAPLGLPETANTPKAAGSANSSAAKKPAAKGAKGNTGNSGSDKAGKGRNL